jgi:hypothetical protein
MKKRIGSCGAGIDARRRAKMVVWSSTYAQVPSGRGNYTPWQEEVNKLELAPKVLASSGDWVSSSCKGLSFDTSYCEDGGIG